jgi:Mn2+/Fe2+ NRAMP family transporter
MRDGWVAVYVKGIAAEAVEKLRKKVEGTRPRDVASKLLPMTTPAAKSEAEPLQRPSGTQSSKIPSRTHLLDRLGPGLITGASDDDPSGIATYSQVGAQFGYGLLWTMLLSYPLMAAIQEICARIGRVTGGGLAANLRKNYPRPILYFVLIAMTSANVFNLGAGIGAMGASLALIVPANVMLLTVTFGIVSLLAVLFIPYTTYAKISEVAYILTLCICWGNFLRTYSMVYCAESVLDSAGGS